LKMKVQKASCVVASHTPKVQVASYLMH
jgi:hypothetical protein